MSLYCTFPTRRKQNSYRAVCDFIFGQRFIFF